MVFTYNLKNTILRHYELESHSVSKTELRTCLIPSRGYFTHFIFFHYFFPYYILGEKSTRKNKPQWLLSGKSWEVSGQYANNTKCNKHKLLTAAADLYARTDLHPHYNLPFFDSTLNFTCLFPKVIASTLV